MKIRSASIIILRGKDMQTRAFHNVCSHRGMKVLWERKGRGGRFSCAYRAWTYDSAGDLANLDSAPAVDMLEFLGPAADRIKNLPFSSYPCFA